MNAQRLTNRSGKTMKAGRAALDSLIEKHGEDRVRAVLAGAES